MLCRLYWICFNCCPTSALWTAPFSGFQTSWSMYHIHFPASSKTIFMTKLGQNNWSNNNFRELFNSVHKLSQMETYYASLVLQSSTSDSLTSCLSSLQYVLFIEYRIHCYHLATASFPVHNSVTTLYIYYFLATLQYVAFTREYKPKIKLTVCSRFQNSSSTMNILLLLSSYTVHAYSTWTLMFRY